MLKKCFLLLSIMIFSQLSFAKSTPITSYGDLLTTLTQGASVRAIILVNKCSTTNASADIQEDAIAGMNFTVFNKHPITIGKVQKNMIATSISTLIEHGKLGTIYNYVRLRVFDDNTAELFSEYLDPRTYQPLGTMTTHCSISNGHDQNGILLYSVS